jgi:hypothetical protein
VFRLAVIPSEVDLIFRMAEEPIDPSTSLGMTNGERWDDERGVAE